MKKNISGIEDIARVSVNQCERTVSYKDIKFRENGVTTTEPSFFNLFSFNLIGGDRQSALAGPNKVVITKSAGDRYFRGEDPIGKILTFKTSGNTIKCEVSGIMEDIPANSHFNLDFFISWETLPKWERDFWYN
jgi:putative ABC transport system permease protein